MKSNLIFRIRVLSALFSLLALLLITRLYLVQIVHGQGYEKDAMGQYIEQSPENQSRGTIYFTTKDGDLVSGAVTQSGWRIAINPQVMKDSSSVFNALNAIVPIDRTAFMAKAQKTSDPYEEVAFRLDDATAAKIRTLKLSGVFLVQDQWRFYPGGSIAAQVLGFVGYKGTTKVGVYGLESEYQSTLAELPNSLYVNPYAEIFSNVTSILSSDPTANQGSIITSIEPKVEAQLETTLDEVMKQYTPHMAGGIIMNPTTGAIYAMSTRPSFDPNDYGAVSDPSRLGNSLVEGRFELGSIMKPLTMAAGIDSGAVTTATTYNDTGCITRSGKKVCNYDFKARGVIPMQEVLNQSLNLGATFVEEKTGHTQFTSYMHKYGFGERSGIDLPAEVQGDIATLGTGNGPDVNYAAASFGQGVAISPIEMIRALAVLANGGIRPNPHVVTGVRYDNGITRAVVSSSSIEVLKPNSAETVTAMLSTVFDKALLKGVLKQDHYSMAAKTGTAQIAIPGGGGYYKDRYLHSFFGYFPARKPQFIVFLFAVEPHGAEFASATLAHPFLDIAKFIINYYNIAPDR